MYGKRTPIDLESLRRTLREEEGTESWKTDRALEAMLGTKALDAEVSDDTEATDAKVPVLVLPRRKPTPRRRRSRASEPAVLNVPYGTVTIGEDMYKGRADIEIVKLPVTLKYICKGAFDGCVNLREVEFPDGLMLIDDRAFKDCRSLEKVVIPGSVERVGAFAFCRCESLEELKIMDGVRQLGRWAFADCYALTNFHKRDLPRSLSKTMQLADTRVVPTWTEAFYGSPCARTVEDKRRQKAAKKWNEKMIMMQRIM